MKNSILSQNDEITTSRKPYRKPQVLKVNLVIKEAVLASGCKTTLTQQASESILTVGCLAATCLAQDGT